MAPCASAAEPKESDDLETVCASGHVLDSEREDPSPASQPALRRQTSAVGAVCSNSASTDLCGGRQVTDVPTATKRHSLSYRSPLTLLRWQRGLDASWAGVYHTGR